MNLKCNAVFEGGGVRGIGHVGAAYVLEKNGYIFQNMVGSSAGAIVAALFACGYTAQELKEIIENMDFLKFRHEGIISSIGPMGKTFSLFAFYGIYDADYFENWLYELLAKKEKFTFGDLKVKDNCCDKAAWRLQVTASDITEQRLLILPRDLEEFGIDPDKFSIAKAVRMSMSIPIFYKPYPLKDARGRVHLIVDGGLLSNYPVWIFDDNKDYCLPTIGFKFVDENGSKGSCNEDYDYWKFPCYMKLLVATALDAADKQHISEANGDFARTVAIPIAVTVNGKAKKISATDFDITPYETELLYQNGTRAAQKFLKYWNYTAWEKQYVIK